jgi:SAM-dependent methyltransferase
MARKAPPPRHTARICISANARRIFYEHFVRSRWRILCVPARALVRWRVQRIEDRQRSSKYYDTERKLAARYAKGRGIDVGCGSKKTTLACIGVDLTPKGRYGFAGSQLFEASQADVVASGDKLPFKDEELDFVIARHNLEHYIDPVNTLQEWRRVLKVGGTLVLIMPDEAHLDTIMLDPTHYHVYTQESMARLIGAVGGFRLARNEQAIPKWSFIVVAKKL